MAGKVHTRKQAYKAKKHGVQLHDYTPFAASPEANICHVSCKDGHWQEFYNKKSSFIYYIEKGTGTFYLNGKSHKVKATDIIVIKPKTKIYYIGKMEMVLVVAPAWRAKDEVHVRFIEKPKRKK